VGRPKHKLKRDRQFNVGLTSREHELLQERARAAGMRPVDYGRARLFGEARHRAIAAADNGRHLDPLFQAQLSRLGNNLNQITRRLNVLEVPPPPSLEPLLRHIRALLAKGTSHGS
jgi:hypothetical protein